ncbi:RNA polymerase sigma factor [Jatrophihabitans sp. YIM 134969]
MTAAVADAGNPALADVGTRLIAGEPTAVEDAYRMLGPLVLGYLRRYVPADDVEDVCQRVFYELWRVHERFDPRYSLRTWVIGIARKRAIDHLRKRRDQVVPLDAVREVTGDDGRETAERLVWADELRSALDSLPEPQRQVIELAYFEGLTQTEVAESLEIPLGTVKTRTARGLQKLAALLQDPDAGRFADPRKDG